MREAFSCNSSFFSLCPDPWQDEWLANVKEVGQTFPQWLRCHKDDPRLVPAGNDRCKVYLLPAGKMNEHIFRKLANLIKSSLFGVVRFLSTERHRHDAITFRNETRLEMKLTKRHETHETPPEGRDCHGSRY